MLAVLVHILTGVHAHSVVVLVDIVVVLAGGTYDADTCVCW